MPASDSAGQPLNRVFGRHRFCWRPIITAGPWSTASENRQSLWRPGRARASTHGEAGPLWVSCLSWPYPNRSAKEMITSALLPVANPAPSPRAPMTIAAAAHRGAPALTAAIPSRAMPMSPTMDSGPRGPRGDSGAGVDPVEWAIRWVNALVHPYWTGVRVRGGRDQGRVDIATGAPVLVDPALPCAAVERRIPRCVVRRVDDIRDLRRDPAQHHLEPLAQGHL